MYQKVLFICHQYNDAVDVIDWFCLSVTNRMCFFTDMWMWDVTFLSYFHAIDELLVHKTIAV